MIRQVLTATVLGAALISGAPAFAQEVRTMSVSYADLNLADDHGAATFQHRIDHAVATICGDVNTGDLAGFAAMGRCRTQARASAKPQMEIAFANADRTGPRAILLASR